MFARNLPNLMPKGYSTAWGDRGYAENTPSGPRWTGRVELIESALEIPLHWRKPRGIFVNSMSDTWHEKLHLRDTARIYAVMAFVNWHTYMILTKRPGNRLAAFPSGRFQELVERHYGDLLERHCPRPEEEPDMPWPLPNVWEGTSCEDQATADERIPLLLRTPAAVRFVSLEPMLGPVDLSPWLSGWKTTVQYPARNGGCDIGAHSEQVPRLNWVIVGGESGPGARPLHPDWARSIRDQCQAAQVPFFFKGWGEWAPGESISNLRPYPTKSYSDGGWPDCGDDWGEEADNGPLMYRVGKRAAGRLLDGVEHNGMPGGVR